MAKMAAGSNTMNVIFNCCKCFVPYAGLRVSVFNSSQSIRWSTLRFQNHFFSSTPWYLSKIYTRTGDKGTSSLFTGERRSKSDQAFEALGTADELSSNLGLAREYSKDQGLVDLTEKIEIIQCMLQDIASNVATPRSVAPGKHKARTELSDDNIVELENWIDGYMDELPPLRNFILPSGGKASSCLHIARTVARRCERTLVPLYQNGDIDHAALKYVNRLSDFLFSAARYAAMKAKQSELIYKRRTSSIHKQ